MSSAVQRRAPGYHHGNLKRVLLDAALRLFAERGSDGFSMRQLARIAGVSSGAPFRHFADKRSLFTALAHEAMDLLESAYAEQLARAGDDPMLRFQALGVATVRFAAVHPTHFRVLHTPEYTAPDPELREKTSLSEDPVLNQLLETAASNGDLDRNVAIARLTAQAAMYGLARMFVDGHLQREGFGSDDAERLATAVARQLGRGISTHSHPPSP